MGRDTRKIFRVLEVSKTFKPSELGARNELIKAIKKYKNDGKSFYPKGMKLN